MSSACYRVRRGPPLALALCAALAGSPTLAAQRPEPAHARPAVLMGIVADTTKTPIPDAEVVATRHRISTITDSRGVFILPGLEPGADVFLVRRIGYRSESFDATLVAGDTIKVGVILAISPFPLPDVVVQAEGRMYFGKLAGFADRMLHSGAPRSSFLTQADIERLRPRKVQDLLSHAGLPFRISRNQETIGCPRGGHSMAIFLDGALMSGGFDLSWLDPLQVQAVEVYRSAAEIPAEFNMARADCTVVIWTR
jgi:hypothetical protein